MKIVSQLVMAVLVLASALMALNEESRDFFKSVLYPEKREVLSTMVIDPMNNGEPVKAVKVLTNESIFVEFYTMENGQTGRLLQRVRLNDRRDAFVSIAGRVTNMALDDVDGDNFFELIVPTFDKDMAARMNVIKYNAASRKFEAVATNPAL